MCSDSWAGSDCSVPRDPNSLVWETLLDTQLTLVGAEHTNIYSHNDFYNQDINTFICTFPSQNQAHRFLHRMGHSLVSGPQGNLWMYGGLSLSEGILGNVYR